MICRLPDAETLLEAAAAGLTGLYFFPELARTPEAPCAATAEFTGF